MASATENPPPESAKETLPKNAGGPIQSAQDNRLAYIRKFAQDRGFEYVAGEYSNKDSPLQWKCAQGHLVTARWDAFRRSRYHCPECFRRAKKGASESPGDNAPQSQPKSPSPPSSVNASDPIKPSAVISMAAENSKSGSKTPDRANEGVRERGKNQAVEIDIPLVRGFSHDDLAPICANCALSFARYLPALKKEYAVPQGPQTCVFCGQSVSDPVPPEKMEAIMVKFPRIQGKIDIINYKLSACQDPTIVLSAEEMAGLQKMPDRMQHLQAVATTSPSLSLNLATHLGHSDAFLKACLKDPRCVVQYAITVLKEPHEYIMRTLKAQGRWAEYGQIAAHYMAPITDQEFAKIKAAGAGSAYLITYYGHWNPNILIGKMKDNAPLTLVEREMPKGILSCLRGPIMKAALAYDTPTAREVFRLMLDAPLTKMNDYHFIEVPPTSQRETQPKVAEKPAPSTAVRPVEPPLLMRDFYFIDLNNFISRSRGKVTARQMHVMTLWNALAKLFAQSSAYHVFMFYSRQNAEFCQTLKSLAAKEGLADNLEWYEEADVKGEGYSDIDTALATKAVETITKQKSGIRVLYLGSGDGDFKPVIQLAKEHRIAVEVVAIAEDSLSYRLKDLVDSPIFLFKR